jgi:hypothetical protein
VILGNQNNHAPETGEVTKSEPETRDPGNGEAARNPPLSTSYNRNPMGWLEIHGHGLIAGRDSLSRPNKHWVLGPHDSPSTAHSLHATYELITDGPK